MNQVMIFEDVDGQPIPRLPHDAQGTARVPDGERLFAVEQAAAHFKRPAAELATLWRFTWADVLGAAIADPPPEAIAASAGSADVESEPISAPTVTDTPRPAANLALRVRLEALRRMLFGHLSEEHFGAFIEMCRIRNLDPWSKQVYPKLQNRKDGEGLEVVLIISIEGLRLQADRTGRYCGNDAAVFDYDAQGKLVKASTTVWKLVEGERRPFTAEVYWDEYRPLSQDTDSLWDRMPRVCLGKCSEAASIRKAFPKETGGLYTPEEMEQAFVQQQHEGRQAESRRPAAPTFAPSDAPRNFDLFCQALEELGVSGVANRTALIAKYRAKMPALAEGNPRMFWNAVLRDLKAQPVAAN